jgi:hypothetical protein
VIVPAIIGSVGKTHRDHSWVRWGIEAKIILPAQCGRVAWHHMVALKVCG